MKKFIFLSILMIPYNAYSDATPLMTAMANVRANCTGISDAMSHLKTMAGINTAISAVGTVSGGVALGTGIIKNQFDIASAAAQDLIDEYSKQPSNPTRQVYSDEQIARFKYDLKAVMDKYKAEHKEELQSMSTEDQTKVEIEALKAGQAALDKKSTSLGHIRTGTMAASTATSIAGAVISGTNKIDDDLATKIGACRGAIETLSLARGQARIDGSATPEEVSHADKIISACGQYDAVDMAKINKRATGGLVASAIGATSGASGTMTSFMANSDNVRNGDAKKEKNLNTVSNVLSGVTTAASATATIFNATQIAAIKKMSDIANECEEAIK